jgi:hypothetical protein
VVAQGLNHIHIVWLAVLLVGVRGAKNALSRHHRGLYCFYECNRNVAVAMSVTHKEANVSHFVSLPQNQTRGQAFDTSISGSFA